MLKQLDTLIGFAVVMSVVSLLITIITQMISSLLGLRGKHLADALEAMVHKIDPTITRKDCKNLLKRILTHAVISDSIMSMSENVWDKVPLLSWLRSRWKMASAIRPDELLAILNDIANATPKGPAGDVANVAVQKAGVVSEPEKSAQMQPSSPPQLGAGAAAIANRRYTQEVVAKHAAAKLLAALQTTTPGAGAAVESLKAQLPGLAAGSLAQANTLIAQLNDATNASLGNLEKWFNSAQDRAQQWFAMNTRLWAVVAAIVMALVLQLDAFQLLTSLSTDSELRANLVGFSSTVKKQADEVFKENTSPAVVNQTALRQLKDSASKNKDPEAAKIGDPPGNLETEAAAEDWLAGQLGKDNPKTSEFLSKLRQIVQSVSQDHFNRARDQFASLTDSFSKSKFQLMPEPYPSFKERQWAWPPRHLFGIFASAALLSLGAPFWFNLLKSLASLRPGLANEVDKDPKQMPAK